MRGCRDATFPGTQTRAIWALALFAAIQVADGVMTAAGVARFGPGVEANPLLDAVARISGFGVALVTAKAVAILCGAVLHVRAQHLVLAMLILAYVAAAIVPWTLVLSL